MGVGLLHWMCRPLSGTSLAAAATFRPPAAAESNPTNNTSAARASQRVFRSYYSSRIVTTSKSEDPICDKLQLEAFMQAHSPRLSSQFPSQPARRDFFKTAAAGVFFFQAEDGIRDYKVTGVQTCALPICVRRDGDRNSLAGGGLAPAME